MSAKLILTRKRSLLNWRQRYKVLIDGVEVGQIKNDYTEEFILSPGQHTLQCKINWMSSGIETFNALEAHNTYRSVGNGMKWIVPLYLMMVAGILISFFHTENRTSVPASFNTMKVILVLPVLIYLGIYMTVWRKKYLLIGEDKSNPFK